MSWSLTRKVSAVLIAVLVFTMASMALFGFYKFEDVMSQLVRSRYSFVAFTIKKKVEDSLNLGFALRQLRQIQETIELEKARDDQIQGIEIYNAQGEILFNSDRGSIGASVPESWLAQLSGAANQTFALMDEESHVVGLPLVNNLGKVEGAVVLLYPTGYVSREMGPMLWRLAAEIGAVVVGFAILASIGVAVVFRPVTRCLIDMERRLGRALTEDGPPLPEAGGEFGGSFDEFVGKTREAVEHIKVSTAEVERLDRLA